MLPHINVIKQDFEELLSHIDYDKASKDSLSSLINDKGEVIFKEKCQVKYNYGLEITYSNQDKRTILHFASLSSIDAEGFNSLVQKYKMHLNTPYGNGDTLLHCAIFRKSPERFEILLKAGADLNAKNHDGQTPQELLEAKRRKFKEETYEKMQTLLAEHEAKKQASGVAVKSTGTSSKTQSSSNINTQKTAAGALSLITSLGVSGYAIYQHELNKTWNPLQEGNVFSALKKAVYNNTNHARIKIAVALVTGLIGILGLCSKGNDSSKGKSLNI